MEAMKNFTSTDYDLAESDLQTELLLNTTKSQFRWEELGGYLMAFMVGFGTGLMSFFFNWGIKALNKVKFQLTEDYIYPGAGFVQPFFCFIGFSVLFGLIAGACGTYVAPMAAGSGVPELKAYLNGVHVKGLLTLRTFLAKSFGLCFAIASGLFAGKEGPFIHIGAIIGGGICGLGSASIQRLTGGRLRAQLKSSFTNLFANSAQHRDFVSAGAAAGISATFGAPIGGVLFALEEGASFFNLKMLWYAVAATAVALYFAVLFTYWRLVGSDNLWHAFMRAPTTFTQSGQASLPPMFYFMSWEIVVFCLLGVVGGVMGAILVLVHQGVSKVRAMVAPPGAHFRRTLEVGLLTLVTVVLFFCITYASPCEPIPTAQTTYTNPITRMTSTFVPTAESPDIVDASIFKQLWCQEGEYNVNSLLFFSPIDDVLSNLIQYESELGEPLQHSWQSMLMLFFVGFCVMLPIPGSGAPVGLFVPSLVVGAAGGRLCGRLVQAILTSVEAKDEYGAPLQVNQACYAAVGAAAVLAGVRRRMLSAAVIVMETTASLHAKSPILFAVFFAKIVGDLLNIGIYDYTIRRKNLPYLEGNLMTLAHQKAQALLTAEDVMTPDPVMIPAIIRWERRIRL